MRRYWLVAGAILAILLMLFLMVQALHIPLLIDPSPWLDGGGAPAGALGVALLIADVVLPVPSSLVMVIHGALFGVLFGTLLSLIGSLGAALLGFALGRRGEPMLARLVGSREHRQADRLLRRWGALAIVVSRPVPLLAETVAILAGASSMGWTTLALAAAAGALPGALLYALAGATAATYQSGALMFGAVLLIAGCFWLLGRALGAPAAEDRSLLGD